MFFLLTWFCLLILPMQTRANCTLEMTIDSSIGVAVYDYIERGQQKALLESCSSILLLVNTPGGVMQTTRLIVEKILNSPIPYLCLIYPAGAHAASAGAIIMQACHVAGAMEATNIGAATPIQAGGQDIPEDMRKKVINDTLSWIEGLIEKRGRSQKFGRDMVTEAQSIGAKEALKMGAIDFVAISKEDFLRQASGKEVQLISNQVTSVQTFAIKPFHVGFRFKLLDIFTEPFLIYFIFMGSLLLLYYEITHPGMLVPGIAGVIGLVISLMSFHKLDVSWAGLLLMLAGIGFMVGEAFVPSFGALGVGGIISFVMGGVFLFDENKFGYELPLESIIPLAIGFGLLMVLLGRIALRTRNLPEFHYGQKSVLVDKGVVVQVSDTSSRKCKVSLGGSIWNAISDSKVILDQEVIVKRIESLTLYVTTHLHSDDNDIA